MSFLKLSRLEYLPKNETTVPGITHLPTSILDAFIPGYSFISKYLLDAFGFDISIIVSVLVLGFACSTGVHYIYRHLWATFLTYFTASVVVDAYDIIYDNLLSWAAEQEDLKRVRSLKVQSPDYTDDVDELKRDNAADDGDIFNFNCWAAKVPPRYEPDSGYHWFRHKGHWFKLSREKTKVQGGWLGMMIQDQETVRLTVLGRSTQPIKELLVEARDRILAKQVARTTVRRPSPKEQRGRGRQAWSKVAVRPSRPMGTVVLERKQKAAILRDINDFLDPETCRWYSNRGLPYRRGYLLSGPPGTGKTSLSFALAGVFGLDIYCLSLSEKNLTEEDLILLFNSLPKRCIVLLEDIDSAGVVRKQADPETAGGDKYKEKTAGSSSEKEAENLGATASIIAQEVTKAVKAATGGGDRASSGRSGGANNDLGVTLSGLLNAIDGVASQEGRVLIMTTNHPELLDDALVRPGRVDMKIEFTRASKDQIRELFVRMYCVDSREAARLPTNLRQILPDALDVGGPGSDPGTSETREKDSILHSHRATKLLPPTPPQTPTPAVSSQVPVSGKASSSLETACRSSQSQPRTGLEEMADKFADLLPEMTFSPAEVQGYLITRKKDPHNALAQVGAWRDAELMKKKGNSNKKKREAPSETHDPGGENVQKFNSVSSASDLIYIEKQEADDEDRLGGKVENSDGADGDERQVSQAELQPRRIHEVVDSGSSALLGNTDGAGDDNSDVASGSSSGDGETSIAASGAREEEEDEEEEEDDDG